MVLTALVIGLLTLIAVPTISDLRINSFQNRCQANAKAIGFACREYATDNNGNYPPSLDALVPGYILNRSILASPLMPSDPNGYIYTPGLKDNAPAKTVLLEDKYSALKGIRLVIHVDDSATVIHVP